MCGRNLKFLNFFSCKELKRALLNTEGSPHRALCQSWQGKVPHIWDNVGDPAQGTSGRSQACPSDQLALRL